MTNPTTVNGPVAFLAFDGCTALRTSRDAIRLASCRRLETIVVNTRRSVYEIVVVDGTTGDILVRGGSDFPEFRRAVFVGATAGGHALRVNTIDIGLRMEFRVGQLTVLTSPVASALRTEHGDEPPVG